MLSLPSRLALLGTAAASPSWLGAAPADITSIPPTPACATVGKGFNDPKINKTVNGNYVSSAQACQDACQATVFCAHWTWYNNTGGCWLQGDDVQQTIESPDVVSGPVRCILDDSPEAKEAAEDATPPIEPEEGGKGSSVMTGVMVFLAIALVACAVLAGIWYSQQGKGKEKSSRGTKLKKTREKASADAEAGPAAASNDREQAATAWQLQGVSQAQVPQVPISALPMAYMQPAVSYAQQPVYTPLPQYVNAAAQAAPAGFTYYQP
eukprot:TRINITY_DN49522_c0_g1_i1.p1 TRINITY_DN49522_c0_g1~~TRINITY_DN49522_c0_g1_i1.p1  ORF type:complete len:294 (-),score=68.67 TRINITY_DN49522_c0_g1_i1:36-833(-)